jgi:predicted pyridoxine 5'-phosphate oxidase superfamily flavin-nucleotide-binding protein
MQIPLAVEQALLEAEAKALATYSSADGVSVVPVSSVRVIGGKIVLVNYFFGQTLRNIEENPDVAMTFWSGLSGYRIKAKAEYKTKGEVFDEVVGWIQETLPTRVVKGVVILTPTALFDISAGPEAGKRVE